VGSQGGREYWLSSYARGVKRCAFDLLVLMSFKGCFWSLVWITAVIRIRSVSADGL